MKVPSPGPLTTRNTERRELARALTRKPKQLDEAPALYTKGGSGPVLTGGDDRRGRPMRNAGSTAPAATDEIGELRDLATLLEDRVPDPTIVRLASQVAARLSLRRRRPDRSAERGAGRAASLPYRGDADDIDLDRTLEVLTERPMPDDEDIVVRTPVRSRRAVTLIVDVSGSMRGEKAHMTAAAVGALAAELRDEEFGLVAFWKDCALLTEPGVRIDPTRLLEDLLRLPAKGLTNLDVGLRVAAGHLARSRSRDRVALLLSDCVHNAGPDPRYSVAPLPRLHVLLQTDGEHDAPLAGELARLGGGRLAAVRRRSDVAPALNRLLRP